MIKKDLHDPKKYNNPLRLRMGAWMVVWVMLLSILGFIPGTMLTSSASSMASVSAAGNDIKVGETVTVYLLFSSSDPIRGVYANIVYDPVILKYVGGDASGDTGSLVISDMRGQDYTEFNYTLTFEAQMTGDCTISVVESGLYNAEAVKIDSPVGSTSVHVTQNGYLSSDATISQISLSYGALSPNFSPEIDHYTVEVPNEITSLSIYVDTTDPAADVSINGSVNLAEGENTRVLKVTAQDGTTKEYTVVIHREGGESESRTETSTHEPQPEISREDPMIMTKVGGISMYVHSVPENYPIPQGFSMVMFPYQGVGIDILQNQEGTLKLIYLTDYKGEEGDLFYYNERMKDCEICVPVYAGRQAYVVFDSKKLTKVPDDYSRVTIKIDNHQLSAFAKNGSASLTSYVVYAAGNDGKKTFYTYDSKKKTMSLYTGKLGDAHDASEVTHEDNSDLVSEENSVPVDPEYSAVESPTKPSNSLFQKILPYLLIGAVLLVLIILILAMLISRSIRKGKNEKAGKDVYDDGFAMNSQVTIALDSKEKRQYERWSNTQVIGTPKTSVTDNTIQITSVRSNRKVPQSWKEETTRIPAVKMNAVHTVSIQEATRKIPKVYSEKAKQPPRRKVPYGMEPGKNVDVKGESGGMTKALSGKKNKKSSKLNADDFYLK